MSVISFVSSFERIEQVVGTYGGVGAYELKNKGIDAIINGIKKPFSYSI